MPYYVVLGNHDNSRRGREFMKTRYGRSYYSFRRFSKKFIVLDVEKEWGRITVEQLRFLRQELKDLDGVKNVLVLFHELIWTQGDARYRALLHNLHSYDGRFESNYWGDLYPLLASIKGAAVFVVAGDVGDNPRAIPALYEYRPPITYVATGMGDVPEENYVRVTANDGEIKIVVVPLNVLTRTWPIERFEFSSPGANDDRSSTTYAPGS